MTQFSDNILWSKEITLLNVVLTNFYIYIYIHYFKHTGINQTVI